MPVAAGVVRDLRMTARRVLAARDMPAERRRATALDRTHHLQLVEAHMPAGWPHAKQGRDRGGCPRPPELVEPSPATLRRRRFLGVSPRTPAARRAQAFDSGGHAAVAGRRLELIVSEQRLNHPNVRAALEQM